MNKCPNCCPCCLDADELRRECDRMRDEMLDRERASNEGRARTAALVNERDEARAYGEKMYRLAREVTCVWCGHQFQTTLGEQRDALLAHARICTESPLPKVEVELDALREYLNDICDAYEAWKKACDHPPGSGINDEDYPGPSADELTDHEAEVSILWGQLIEDIETACAARQEP